MAKEVRLAGYQPAPSGSIGAKFEGIYELPECARYLLASRTGREIYHASSTKLIRWLRSGIATESLIHVPGRDLLVTFEDLVSFRVIAALRAANVTFQKIRVAERWLREQTEHPRPFATELLWTEGSEVFTDFANSLIAVSKYGQLAMEVLRAHLIPIHGLMFSDEGIAETWEPHPDVLLHPLIQFGAPCVKGTRVPTQALHWMATGGDSIEYIAGSYGLSEAVVSSALKWEERVAA